MAVCLYQPVGIGELVNWRIGGLVNSPSAARSATSSIHQLTNSRIHQLGANPDETPGVYRSRCGDAVARRKETTLGNNKYLACDSLRRPHLPEIERPRRTGARAPAVGG